MALRGRVQTCADQKAFLCVLSSFLKVRRSWEKKKKRRGGRGGGMAGK